MYLAVLGLNCGMRDLVSWPGIEPRPSTLGVRVLATELSGKSPKLYILDRGLDYLNVHICQT